jgi:hypothetical protein
MLIKFVGCQLRQPFGVDVVVQERPLVIFRQGLGPRCAFVRIPASFSRR